MKKEALRVTTTVPVAPTTLYLAWLNAEQHSAMTGETAKIDPQVGGAFTALNGYVNGKLVTLDLGRRIVMSWRTVEFPRESPDSRAEVHFEALGASTRLTILHTDIPEGQSEKCRESWNEKYFGPMRTFFSKYLPDPRQPPPPRRPPPLEAEEEEVTPTEGRAAQVVAPIKKVDGKSAAPRPTALPARTVPAKVSKLVATKTKEMAKPAKKAAAKPAAKKPVAKKPAAAKKPAIKKPAATKKPAVKKPAAKRKIKKR